MQELRDHLTKADEVMGRRERYTATDRVCEDGCVKARRGGQLSPTT